MGRLARANATRQAKARSEVEQGQATTLDRCECGDDHTDGSIHVEAEDAPARHSPPAASPTTWKVGHMTVRVDRR
jgi:hypothetical protein